MWNFPEECKIVRLYQGAANAVACDIVSCKNANKVWFVVSHVGATDTDLVLTLNEATDVAGGTNANVTATCPIWLDADAGTSSDVLVRQADAASLTIDPATQGSALAVIEWDPAKHTEGYDCITLADSGGNAANTCAIFAVIDSKRKGGPLPSFITD